MCCSQTGWDPDKAYGGIGAVLLRQDKSPLTYGTSVPDHLSAQLLTAADTAPIKKQRNTQCELLAVFTALLTWREELKDSSLLVLSGSTAAIGNLKAGTADDGTEEARLAGELAAALAPAKGDKARQAALWDEHYLLVYALAEQMMDRTIREF